MAEEYYKARVDSFLASADVKSRDCKPFGCTQEQKEERRRQLILAGKKRKKFSQQGFFGNRRVPILVVFSRKSFA